MALARLDIESKYQNNKYVSIAPSDLVVANLIFVTLLLVSYAYIRRGSNLPVQLNLKNREQEGTSTPGNVSKEVTPLVSPDTVRNPSRIEYRPRARSSAGTGPPVRPLPRVEAAATTAHLLTEKELNVLFNWNGHTWDAYEVLGIPAGSSSIAVEAAYERMCRSVRPDSIPFITAAYEAILKCQ